MINYKLQSIKERKMLIMKKTEFDIIEKILEILDLYVNENDHSIYESGEMLYMFPDKEQLKIIKFILFPNEVLKLNEDNEVFFNPLRNNRLARFILDDFMMKNDIDEFDVVTINSSFHGKFIRNGESIYELSGISPLSALMVTMIIDYSEDGDEDYHDIKKKLERIIYNGTDRRPEKGNKKSKTMV